MSKTFAVETYSGGVARILSIRTRPSLRSFFSFALFTLMSLARFSACMRWSRERAGAFTGAFVTMAGDSSLLSPRVQRDLYAALQRFYAVVRVASEGVAAPS